MDLVRDAVAARRSTVRPRTVHNISQAKGLRRNL